ncbi:serine/threonine-protein kinase [Pseudoxanthomonas daejeonensis]|uniref:serine/threonine-protein kinase n=1 Tax=Pseudoxanthomonas daejeonensis TaxID=266062 RepID=UPI001F54794E|nr:serine/threonine-protein kinase [Pseudoxanthomonas daejeonensis]UNK58278.1 serine/threonine-protein kinase [Pseudoxanthomonas daejeonensis]
MDAETLAYWRTADALFDQWLDLPAGEREAWLAAQSPEAPVRNRLERLVAAHLRPDVSLDPLGHGLSGCQLGDWTLEDELGRGGMAVVYRAQRERGMARQHAAIKILTLGAIGANGRERFHREAAILARLDHPGITPLVDSGTTADGTCWLAMALVQGERIDEWCRVRCADAHAVVHLYLQVCEAVACAHRHLVVHRDLKPSNVLVDGEGHARLLDFGIGQYVDAGGERTLTLWRALTPGYAAPEQLRGDPPSTAVDIYGLGALLHRLLTGRTPQAITQGADTTRPSLLVRAAGDAYHHHYVPLKNDLDRVLLKALAEQPDERYATAEALADDLRRWLDGLPVLAQPPKPAYRLRKFVGRHKAAVAAAGVLVLAVAGGVGATLWQADIAREHAAEALEQAVLARREAENARQRAHRAEAVRDFLGNMFVSTRGGDGGAARVDEVMAATAAGARGEYLAKDPQVAADLLLLTGSVRYNLDDYVRSREDLEQALQLLAPHADGSAGELARVHWELGRHARREGDAAAMASHYRQAVAFNQRWDAPPNESLRARISLAEALLQSDRQGAERMFRALVDEIAASGLKDSIRHLNALNGLSIALAGPGQDPRLRLPVQEERLRIARKVYGPDDGGLAFTLSDVTHTYRGLGLLDQAEALARESIEVADRSLQRPLILRAMTRCNLGLVLQQGGRHEESLPVFRQSVAMLRELDDDSLPGERCSSGLAYAAAAGAHAAEALQALARSDELLTRHRRTRHVDAVKACGLRASVLLRRGDAAAAGRTLSGCAPADVEQAPVAYLQARAEWLLVTGQTAAASVLLRELRDRQPPVDGQREWMRSWMLSALLTQRMEGGDAVAALASGLGSHATLPVLAQCLARPAEDSCLALP